MKLAIVLPTYQREDGMTPFFLRRTLDSVMEQTHQDFKLFIVGDLYEDKAEFEQILLEYPQEKIHSINLETAVEREKYRDDPKSLWHSGGVNATLVGTDLALKEGFDYICHLDHDDVWYPNHLQLISEVIDATGVDWVCTKARFSEGVYPEVESSFPIVPFLPVPGRVFHSTTCYNYKTIPLRPEDVGTEPADMNLLGRIAEYVEANGLVSYLINEITCEYEENREKETPQLATPGRKSRIGVSICCLTYNHETIIRDAIEGFLMQRTNFPIEIVIYDDASTDSNPEILQEYADKFPKKIKLFLGKENQFRKTGLYPFPEIYERAKGRYIADCDGDDYWTDPLKLQKQYDFMEEHPECSMCHHKHLILENGVFREERETPLPDYTRKELIECYGSCGIHTSVKFWRNIVQQNKQDFRDFRADYATTVLMGMHGESKNVKEVGPSIFRLKHPGSSWCALPLPEMERQTMALFQTVYDNMVKKGNPKWIAWRRPFVNL